MTQTQLYAGIDLGKWKVGIGLGTKSRLLAATTTQTNRALPWSPEATAKDALAWIQAEAQGSPVSYTIEWPSPRPGELVVVEDILSLQAVGRALIKALGKGSKFVQVSPSTWKGTLPKEVHRRRLARILSPEELALMPEMDQEHDTWDGVGLYLYGAGRSGRAGTPKSLAKGK